VASRLPQAAIWHATDFWFLVSIGRHVDFKWSRPDFQSVITVVSNSHQRNEVVALCPRLVEQRVADAMSDTRVVLIVSPRQSGKTTLAKKMANKGME
jgi:hypothetical protein